jgi:aminopeptidase N
MKKSFLFVALLAVGCIPRHTQHDFVGDGSESNPDNNTEVQISGDGDSDVATERPVYQATETVFTDLITTKLEVSFDWKKAQLIGKETLTAKPHFYASDKLILDAKGMEIKSVTMNGAARPYTYEKDILTIALDKTYQRTENYTVVIDYIAKPDERTLDGSAAITSDKGLYFINPRGEDPNKMPQIWTQGETESSSVWFPTIDAPNVKTKQEMLITVEDKYTTLSNGKFMGSKKNADGTRTDHWKQDLPHAPYLFMMGVGGFKVVKDSYKRADGTLMEVNYYVEPEWEQHAKDIFGETPKMIAFFSKLMDIDYPWDKYDQIIVRDYVSGAMENTGAVVFGDYAYKTRRELLDGNDNSTIAHELFHHWFGDLVTAESWSNLTLNESFANYSQYLWDEYRYGIDEADLNANGEMEVYFQSGAMGGFHDLFWADYADKEDMFDAHSYNKGGRILHMLRNYLGDEAFFQGMQLYLKTNQFKAAEFHQLRLAFEEVSGEDLHWFFDQWYEASGHPVLNVNYVTSAGAVTLDVTQTQDLKAFPVFRLPVDVVVFDDKGATTHRIDIDQVNEKFELPVTGTLKNVLFDNQAMVLAQVKEKKASSWYIHQFYNGKRWRARRDALNNGIKERTPEANKMVLDALDDPFWDIRLTAIEKVALLSGGDKSIALEKIKKLAQTDPSSAVRSSAISALSAGLSETEATPIMEQAVQSDSSYMVINNALTQLGKMNPQSAMKLAKPLEKERSSSMLTGIATLYARHGKAEQFAFFERILSSNVLQGFDQVGGLYNFSAFLIDKDLSLFQKSLKIYEDKAKNGDMYSKMYMGNYLDQLTAHLEERIVGFKEEQNKQKQAGNSNGVDVAKAKQAEAQALIVEFKRISASVGEEDGH